MELGGLVPRAGSCQELMALVLAELLSERACTSEPRGRATSEIVGVSVCLTDPRRRLVVRPPQLRWSLPFAMGEYLWYMRGEDSVDTVSFYAPSIRAFSDDGKTLNSAYGYRIFGGHPRIAFDQWQAVKRRLQLDPESRQAVVHIRTPQESLVETKDHPCTIALQFLQRGGRLHLVTMMRSNDVVFGTPYDIFSFTMMQEQMALELGLELGTYVHQVASWHLYAEQRELAEAMLQVNHVAQPMPAVEVGLEEMIRDEERLRRGHSISSGTGYWRDWRLVLGAFSGTISDVAGLSESYRPAWEHGRQRPGASSRRAARPQQGESC